MRLQTVALLACLGGLLVAAPGDALARGKRHGGGGSVEGRRHLKKANAFASQNKCHHALSEYTKAYANLHDPVVLFNRAECYRRLGDNTRAAADYRAFLKGVPDAPNREEIEARIASLEGTPAGRELEAAQAEPPPEPKPRAKSEPAAAAPPPAPPAPEPETEPETPPPRKVVAEAAALPKAAPPPEPGSAAPLIAAQAAAPAPAEEKPKVGAVRWVLLVGLVLAVAGAGTAGYLLLRPRGQVIPSSDLGDYRF